jgi:DNA-binding transcriptional MerR regulator/methylmalonyl-CoA mutase cobalamin-binding subunit
MHNLSKTNKVSMVSSPSSSVWTIAEVERETGLGKDTLRVWERRYGFPDPQRDAQGERLYTQEQVDRLRLVRRLMAGGHRPGKLVPMPLSGLQSLLAAPEAAAPEQPAAGGEEQATMAQVEQVLRAHDAAQLRRLLLQSLSRLGLGAFSTRLLAPLTTRIGLAWLEGRLQVFEEHLFTEAAQAVMRQAIQALPEPAPAAAPRVLLTTLPGEPHALGLLMAEAMCALEGCVCVNLGVQTPVDDIVQACISHRVDVLGLSATGCLPARQMQAALSRLRTQLPDGVWLWLGGSAGGQAPRRPMVAVRHFAELGAIAPAVAEWRAAMEMAVPGA